MFSAGFFLVRSWLPGMQRIDLHVGNNFIYI